MIAAAVVRCMSARKIVFAVESARFNGAPSESNRVAGWLMSSS